jgi:multiple sugar transport system permease protein
VTSDTAGTHLEAGRIGASPIGPAGRQLRNRSRFNRWQQIRARKGALFTLPFFVGFAGVFAVPLVWAVVQSLFASTKSGLGLGAAVVRFVGLQNYVEGFTDAAFWSGIVRVILFAVVLVPLSALLSLSMALLIDQVRAKTARAFRFLFLIPYMVPGIVATLIWIYLYSPNVGPLTPFFGFFGIDISFYSSGLIWVSMGNLILWSSIGFNMLILFGSLQAIPRELFDAARLDGASEFRIALSIKVPFVRGTLVLTTMLSIIGMLQIFNEPLLFRSVTPETVTKDFVPVQMIYFTAFDSGNPYYAAALSVILALIVGAASFLFYRFTNRPVDS